MAFTPVPVSSPSSTITALITNDNSPQTELDPIAQAIAQAQGQLHLTIEAKQAEDLQQWMEKGWEEQMSERDLVVALVDKELVREAAEHAMVEIQKRWFKVSVGFLLFYIQISDLVAF